MPRAIAALLALASFGDCLSLATAASLAPPAGNSGLLLETQMADSFLEGDPIRFRVTIGNSLEACKWAFIDPVLVPSPCGDRPFSIVKITLQRVGGGAIVVPERALALHRPIGAGELLSLNCGEFFGGWFEIGAHRPAQWRTTLPPGRYLLNITVHLRVRSYFEERPDLLAAEARQRLLKQDFLLKALADQTLESRQLSFSVIETPSAPPTP